MKIDKKVLSQSNPSWRTTPKEGTTPFDPTRKAKATKSTAPIKVSRREWVIENGEKMDAIRKKQAQTRQENREQAPQRPEHDRSTGKGQFNAQSDPKSHNRTTREAHRAKTSAEAEASRERTPPEYRAEPYPPKDDSKPNSDNESLKDKVQSRFKDATGVFKEKWHPL